MGKYNSNNNSKSNSLSLKVGFWFLLIIGFVLFALIGATENYSEGERIGFITKFSYKGRFYKSWEGELNMTQTGMNTSSTFDFSIDNDNQQGNLISMIDSAVNNGWKVKLTYHETSFKNWFSNRGETDYFIKDIQILDRHSLGNNQNIAAPVQGRVIDTIYVVIDKSQLKNK